MRIHSNICIYGHINAIPNLSKVIIFQSSEDPTILCAPTLFQLACNTHIENILIQSPRSTIISNLYIELVWCLQLEDLGASMSYLAHDFSLIFSSVHLKDHCGFQL